MERILREILNKIDSIETKMESMENRLNSRMDSIETKIDSIENRVGSVEGRLGSLESEVKTGFIDVNRKLDTIYAQVAHNTEQEIKLTDLTTRVESLETDNKLIKKIISNQ